MSKGKKKKAKPSQQPATMADVNRAKDKATGDGCRIALALVFTVLLDKEGFDVDDMQRVWDEVQYLSDSVSKKIVKVTDLVHTLREEYGIRLWES